PLYGQCVGYTQAQVNWDNLDYYWNSGGSGNTPYSNYISNSDEQTQRFAIGKTSVTIATSSASLINPGSGNSAENGTHTGDVAGFTGEDVQYQAVNNQTITLTFAAPVCSPSFTLYDVDRSAQFTITALNNINLPTAVNVTTYASTILTVGVLPLSRTITASSSSMGNSSNRATATINVPGLVNSITITINNAGSDPVFWMSDINAYTSGTFPMNWHQGANNRPFWGPTQSQPDYFLVTPDNHSIYMIDPATGNARELLADYSKDYTNSLGYDPYNHFLYYISENYSIDQNNKTLKRYDYNTETSSVLVADITAAPLNIPTFSYGVESAGCAFYDGALYLGIEGGTEGSNSNLRTRETIIWRIDFDASYNPISAVQVFATDAATNGSSSQSLHDWGDFIIKNGEIYDFSTARNGSDYSNSTMIHYNLQTGNRDATYYNPGSSPWNGQAAMTWAQELYFFRASSGSNSVIGKYDEAGNCGATTTINVLAGPSWPGGSGDGSDPFRPKCDFGDAPASYDPYSNPATQSPAVHERSDNIRLGNTWDNEFDKRGTSGNDDIDDGLAYAQILSPLGGSYSVKCTTYNNSGANATLIAWLDYNGNGTFDASEAITPITVPSSASNQQFWLYWPTTPNSFSNGDSTYLRIRITSASAGMNANHATGYFETGEVEDWKVFVDNFPLAVKLLNFDAKLSNGAVTLSWKTAETNETFQYEIERSTDNSNWKKIKTINAQSTEGTFDYMIVDDYPEKGVSYY
ncbi:MAG TPA: GEVED domain-containing protein, partial [Chitinophagaceae bacterium]|nr:GEVED domain-containing protein [Chitinophagaceae bacterium]